MSTTNLDFLKVGGLYPPSTEVARLARYKRYDDLFYSRITEAYGSYIKKDDGIGNSMFDQMKSIFANPKIMNYARAITKKTVDLALSKKPYVIPTKKDKDIDIMELQHGTDIWKKTRQALTDVSRYGNGYIREYNKIPRYSNTDGLGRVTLSKGEPACNAINPSMVVEVVNPLDREDTTYFVLGWIDKVEEDLMVGGITQYNVDGITTPKYTYYLTTEIHKRGAYQYRRFRVGSPILNYGQVKQYSIIEEVTDESLKDKWIPTGLEGFAIKKLSGYTTTDNPSEGLSDYDMLDTLMIELVERVSQLSQVFTKHGDPAMQGSPELLSQDENGNPVFYTGDFYPIGKDEQPLSYITWNSQSREILEYCNQILQNIWVLTEMGDGSIMGYTRENNGFAESGKGLRMKLASPLMKVQSLLIDNQDTIISIFTDFATILGKKIKPTDIEIKWQDGLPVDHIEEANIFQMRVQSGTESIVYGLQRRYNMTPEQAEKEYKKILEEKKQLHEAESNSNSGEAYNQEGTKNDLQNKLKGGKNNNEEAETREETERRLQGQISGTAKQ